MNNLTASNSCPCPVDPTNVKDLIETIADDPETLQDEKAFNDCKNVVIEALNEHLDKFFVEPNKHINERHRDAIHRILSEHKNSIYSLI